MSKSINRAASLLASRLNPDPRLEEWLSGRASGRAERGDTTEMEMTGPSAGHRTAGLRVCMLISMLAAMIAALSLVIASPAQAATGLKAWGLNKDGELGNGTETGGHGLGEASDVLVTTSRSR